MSNSNAPAPAIPSSILLPRIIGRLLTEGEACELYLDQQFMSASFRAHQIVRMREFAHESCRRELSIKGLARVFEISPKAIRHALKKGYEIPVGRGEHYALDDRAEAQIMEWITKKLKIMEL